MEGGFFYTQTYFKLRVVSIAYPSHNLSVLKISARTAQMLISNEVNIVQD